ncbi:MAG: efflux RND transporter permease subunit, partial [Candidatus Cloacimonetes bacterium]|nr:efflux RND transporter permease subunit [Candidatus Cloacimonadota bacterium]
SEIALAVMASTLTNIVVFVPLATMSSLVGQFFREFALTVTFATIFSLITAFTVTPLLASRLLSSEAKTNRFGLRFDRLFGKFAALYKGFLGRVLSSKKRSRAIILVTVAVLALSFALIPVIGLEFIPEMDQGEMSVTVELPQGHNLDQTAATLQTIHQRLGKHPEIVHVITNLGSAGYVDTGTHLASCSIKLVEANRRKLNSKQLADRVTRELADVPNARIKVNAISSGFGEDTGLEFYLQGQETARLEQLKSQISNRIKDTPGLTNLDTSTRGGRTELTVTPKRSEMAAVGATVYDLALALRAAVEGMVSTQYHAGGNQYDIKLSLEDAAVDSPDKIGNLSVVVNYQPYLLSQLADVSFGEGTNRITHRDRSKTVVFSAGIAAGATMGDVISGVKQRLEGVELPRGYKIVWGGSAEMLSDMVGDMLKTLILAVLLTYMLLAALLESFVQPLFILGTVPLAVIGVILSLLITGQTFNLVSLMSIIMLVGIVVNNAILLLDYANLRRKRGIAPHDALMEAGEAKLKPIIMSTLAIAIGMLPMALGIGPAGRELRMPMGIVMIGGLIVSAFLTLVIIPAFYYLTTKSSRLD